METKTADATLSTRTLLWVISITIEVKEDDHDQFENDKRKKRRKNLENNLRKKLKRKKKDSMKLEERKTRGGKSLEKDLRNEKEKKIR